MTDDFDSPFDDDPWDFPDEGSELVRPRTEPLPLDLALAQAWDMRYVIEGELLRRDFYRFVKAAWPVIEPGTTFIDNWHIAAICQHLEAVTRGEILRLIINIPPRFAKSTLVSVLWPAWVWLQRPSAKFLTASYAKELATRDAVNARRLMESTWYRQRFGHLFEFTSDQNVKTRYQNDKYGYRVVTSVESGGTGEGGDFLTVDDPINAKEANTELGCYNAVLWWSETMSTRYNDPKTSAAVIVMQRLAANDLTGYLLAQGGWDHLCLPMRYEVPTAGHPRLLRTSLGFDDPRTVEGELLCPQRYDEAATARLETELGEYGAAAQLGQRPNPRSGAMFKPDLIRVLDVLPAEPIEWVRAWDLAASEQKPGSEPAWTVGLKLGRRPSGRFIIADVQRLRGLPDAVEAAITSTARSDGVKCPIDLPQDPGQAGKSQVLYYVNQLAGYILHYSPESGSKVTRAQPVASQMNAGNFDMVTGPWNHALKNELRSFPNTGFKDQVDALSRAFARLAGVEVSTGMLDHYRNKAAALLASKIGPRPASTGI